MMNNGIISEVDFHKWIDLSFRKVKRNNLVVTLTSYILEELTFLFD